MSNIHGVAANRMIEAALPLRSKHHQDKVGLVRYVIGCTVGIAAFFGMLWLAS